jgi:hypothetical protein
VLCREWRCGLWELREMDEEDFQLRLHLWIGEREFRHQEAMKARGG